MESKFRNMMATDKFKKAARARALQRSSSSATGKWKAASQAATKVKATALASNPAAAGAVKNVVAKGRWKKISDAVDSEAWKAGALFRKAGDTYRAKAFCVRNPNLCKGFAVGTVVGVAALGTSLYVAQKDEGWPAVLEDGTVVDSVTGEVVKEEDLEIVLTPSEEQELAQEIEEVESLLPPPPPPNPTPDEVAAHTEQVVDAAVRALGEDAAAEMVQQVAAEVEEEEEEEEEAEEWEQGWDDGEEEEGWEDEWEGGWEEDEEKDDEWEVDDPPPVSPFPAAIAAIAAIGLLLIIIIAARRRR